MERSVKTTGGRLAYNKMWESLKLCSLVRLFVCLVFYLETSLSVSHFGSTGAFDYNERSSEIQRRDIPQRKGIVCSFLGLLCLILPGLATRDRCEATATDSVTALLYPLPSPSMGPVGFEQSSAWPCCSSSLDLKNCGMSLLLWQLPRASLSREKQHRTRGGSPSLYLERFLQGFWEKCENFKKEVPRAWWPPFHTWESARCIQMPWLFPQEEVLK